MKTFGVSRFGMKEFFFPVTVGRVVFKDVKINKIDVRGGGIAPRWILFPAKHFKWNFYHFLSPADPLTPQSAGYI